MTSGTVARSAEAGGRFQTTSLSGGTVAQERPTYTIERPLVRFRATVCPLVHANDTELLPRLAIRLSRRTSLDPSLATLSDDIAKWLPCCYLVFASVSQIDITEVA